MIPIRQKPGALGRFQGALQYRGVSFILDRPVTVIAGTNDVGYQLLTAKSIDNYTYNQCLCFCIRYHSTPGSDPDYCKHVPSFLTRLA